MHRTLWKIQNAGSLPTAIDWMTSKKGSWPKLKGTEQRNRDRVERDRRAHQARRDERHQREVPRNGP